MTKKSSLRTLVLILFFAGALAAASLPAAQDAKPFLGDWKGAIAIMGQELEILTHFTAGEGGAVNGTFDSPAQGAFGLPLGNIKIEGQKIAFMISGVPGDPTFNGELDAEAKKLTGTFTQSGMEGTFSLEKQVKN
jgi:hypothetical protein